MEEKQISYISLLQVVSCCAVVFLHSNGCFWQFSTGRYWFTANIIESVFYFAVPVFFMITGITLINYPERYTLAEYLKRRAKKTLLPFIAWSLIGLLYLAAWEKVSLSELTILDVIRKMMDTSIISIYWFFPPLFCIYLSIPLFAAVPKTIRIKVFSYLFVAGLTFNCLVPFVNEIIHLDLPLMISVIPANNYLLYVIGGILFHERPTGKKARIAIYLLGALGLIAHITGTYILSLDAGMIVKTYKGYLNLPCVLYSFAVLTFFMNNEHFIMKGFSGTLINTIKGYTLPIYLMHWYLLDLMKIVSHIPSTSILYRLGAPFLVVPTCILLTWILRKIPIVKHIVP